MEFGDLIASPDQEGKEKHVPQIHCPDKVKAGEWFDLTVVVGEEVPHPNTPEHHIAWIGIYYKENGARPVFQLAQFRPSPVRGDSRVSLRVKVDKPGVIWALEHCNIHGIWANSKDLEVE